MKAERRGKAANAGHARNETPGQEAQNVKHRKARQLGKRAGVVTQCEVPTRGETAARWCLADASVREVCAEEVFCAFCLQLVHDGMEPSLLQHDRHGAPALLAQLRDRW